MSQVAIELLVRVDGVPFHRHVNLNIQFDSLEQFCDLKAKKFDHPNFDRGIKRCIENKFGLIPSHMDPFYWEVNQTYSLCGSLVVLYDAKITADDFKFEIVPIDKTDFPTCKVLCYCPYVTPTGLDCSLACVEFPTFGLFAAHHKTSKSLYARLSTHFSRTIMFSQFLPARWNTKVDIVVTRAEL